MHRFLLTPRWLAFHLLVLLAIPLCVVLARWQYARYAERTTADQAPSQTLSAPAVPLTSLLPAGAAVTRANWDRLVTVSGEYDPARQFLAPARQAGVDGFAVVGLLRRADGPAIPVNQGFLPGRGAAPGPPPTPPAGRVDIRGRLEPPQDAAEVGVAGLPAGQIPVISPAILANEVSYPLANAYLVRTAGPAAATLTAAAVPTHRVATGDTVGPWQNLAYVAQWAAFAVVILGLWARIVTREARHVREQAMDQAIADLAATAQAKRPTSS